MLNLSCLDQAAEEAVKQCCGVALRLHGLGVLGLGFPFPPSLLPSQPPSSYNLKPFPPLFPTAMREMPSAAAVPGLWDCLWDDWPHPPPLWTLPGEVALHPTDE